MIDVEPVKGTMITLRDYRMEDADRLVALANNPKVCRYLVYNFPNPYSKKDAEWWITTGSKTNEAITKAIACDGEFVGSIGIAPQGGWRDHLAEIGYWLGEDYWGNGIASEAVWQMSDYAFNTLKFRKLYAPVLDPNKASMRVLEKCGYQLEGILRREVMKDGRYFDVYHYAKQHS